MAVTIHKTLVLRLSSIGDVILATPFIRALKEAFPGMSLDVAVRREFAELLAHNPRIDRCIEVDTREGSAGLRALRVTLRERGYDAVFDLHNNFRTRLLRRGVAPLTRVVRKRSIRRLLLVRWKLNLLRAEPGISARYQETFAGLGVTADAGPPEVFVPDAMREAVFARLRGLGVPDDATVIGLAPGARHFTKRWPAEHWASLASALTREEGTRLLLFGGAEDREVADAIAQAAPARAVNLCGALSLLETAAALSRCAAACTNDSGLMHLATARSIPVVALFGSTVRELGFFPLGAANTVLEIPGLACRPCTHIGRSRCPEGHFRCMRDIAPATVAAAILRAAGRAATGAA
jgi:heptosyltransferase-2